MSDTWDKIAQQDFCYDELDEDGMDGTPVKRACERLRDHSGDHESGAYRWDKWGWSLINEPDAAEW